MPLCLVKYRSKSGQRAGVAGSGCALLPASEQMATRPTAVSEFVASLFVSVGPSLFRYLARATGSFGITDDIIQDAFLALNRELYLGKRIKNPSAYAFAVARTKSASTLARNVSGAKCVPETLK